jgi:tetratricopeptide (TPR) repeat protein
MLRSEPGRWTHLLQRGTGPLAAKESGAYSLLLLILIAVAACSPPSLTLDQDPAVFADQEERLLQRLEAHPEDPEALRDLGSIYLRTGRASLAYDVLEDAYERLPHDPQVLFYFGMATEKIGLLDRAMELYGQYADIPEDSPYGPLLEGRYAWLQRQQAQMAAMRIVAEEIDMLNETIDEISPDIVAVMPLEFSGRDEQYQALGRGIAETVATNLSGIDRLRVVERIRLQAILNELQLAESEYVAEASAPRTGRLLGAGQLVGGNYSVDADQLRLNVTLARLDTRQHLPGLRELQAGTDDIFDLIREITFSVVDRLGIELTPDERAAIEEVPTEDLQAFLAFSRGLFEEERGNFRGATQHFQEAHQIDPAFEAAAERQRQSERIGTGWGEQEQVIENEPEGAAPVPTSTVDVLAERLQSMGASTPSASDEGSDDERDPPSEARRAEGDSPLQDPPPPPPPPDDGRNDG